VRRAINTKSTDLITRDYTTPEADVGPTLAVCGLLFRLEVWNGGSRRDGIEGHVDDRCDTSRSGCLGSCCETFPIGAPWLVEVDMGATSGDVAMRTDSVRRMGLRTLRVLGGYRDRHSR